MTVDFLGVEAVTRRDTATDTPRSVGTVLRRNIAPPRIMARGGKAVSTPRTGGVGPEPALLAAAGNATTRATTNGVAVALVVVVTVGAGTKARTAI